MASRVGAREPMLIATAGNSQFSEQGWPVGYHLATLPITLLQHFLRPTLPGRYRLPSVFASLVLSRRDGYGHNELRTARIVTNSGYDEVVTLNYCAVR